MKTQLNPSADGKSCPDGSKTPNDASRTTTQPHVFPETENLQSSIIDEETKHLYCNHDFKLKMLGGLQCKSCGVGKTKSSTGIKSNLLASQLHTNSYHFDHLPDVSKKFGSLHNVEYLN